MQRKSPKTHKMSEQFIMSTAFLLNNAILASLKNDEEGADVTQTLEGFQLALDPDGKVYLLNPPAVQMTEDDVALIQEFAQLVAAFKEMKRGG